MTPEQFTYWLQGYSEIGMNREAPDAKQWEIIVEHLQTVFHKVTPSFPDPFASQRRGGLPPLEQQAQRQAIC